MVKSNTNNGDKMTTETQVYYYRSNGTHFVINIGAGEPGIFVKSVGKFAKALVRRRIGHNDFTLRPV
jgi:3-methyladenine DNA glycosylase Mpg